MPVGVGGQRRDLGDQPDGGHVALFRVVDLLRVGIEGGERADAREQHPHRVGVVAEALEQVLEVLVDVGVVGDVEGPALELRLGRQLAPDQQVGDLEEGRVLAQRLDRVAAVFEDPGVAVDVGDRGSTGGGVGEGRVVGHHPEFVLVDLDLAQVEPADGAVGDRQLVGLAGAVVGDGQSVRLVRNPVLGTGVSRLLLGGHHPPSPARWGEPSIPVRRRRPVNPGGWWTRVNRERGGETLELGHPAERLEALVDLGAVEPRDALGAELLDVEGGEDGAVAHRPPQVRLVEVAVRSRRGSRRSRRRSCRRRRSGRARPRAGSRAGRRSRPRRCPLPGEEGGAVLAALGDDRARAHRPSPRGRPGRGSTRRSACGSRRR